MDILHARPKHMGNLSLFTLANALQWNIHDHLVMSIMMHTTGTTVTLQGRHYPLSGFSEIQDLLVDLRQLILQRPNSAKQVCLPLGQQQKRCSSTTCNMSDISIPLSPAHHPRRKNPEGTLIRALSHLVLWFSFELEAFRASPLLFSMPSIPDGPLCSEAHLLSS